MFHSKNYLHDESISLDKEITKLGVQQTPLTSLLMGLGKVGKINAPAHTWREVTLDSTDDIGAVEGNKDIQFYQSQRAQLSNYAEIFQKGVSVSGTVQAMSGNAINNQFAQETNDRLLELKMNLERKLTEGSKNDGSTAPYIRRMQGIENWVDSANVVTGPAIEESIIEVVKKLWANSGSGSYIGLVNAPIKSELDKLYKDAYHYVSQTNTFGIVVNRIQTSFGNVDLILTPYASDNKLTVFDVNDLKIEFLRQPQFQPLGKQGDATEGFVVAEATLYVASPKKVAQLVTP
ncbi:SU10 major capsid protein [Paenibacillus vini]|uniref:Phage capsid protein n=1 Tax=Paenibacillus vini TaxID=1476024 RepID=A0ABQ4M887_9BACL|nr:DUF5309 family protein [Paenibacillus vini]GIP52203.1 hypothetical protein J42TS3_12380 [Paenibacillus vini]